MKKDAMIWKAMGNNDKDPWSGKPKPSSPPDLEQALRDFCKKISGALNNNNRESYPPRLPPLNTAKAFSFLVFLLVLIWGLLGFFIVGPDESAVVTRLGRYVTVLKPGLHWIAPLVESRTIVSIQRINSFDYTTQAMTQDANLVNVSLVAHYRISRVKAYVFKVRDPERVLQQIVAANVAQIVGKLPLETLLSSGRDQLRVQLQNQIQMELQQSQTGLQLTDIVLQAITPPVEIKNAFNEIAKAQEDSSSLEKQAQAYALQVEPSAVAKAQRLMADARAYQQQVILKAKGDIAQYLALLPMYQKYPVVTKQRLYIDTMESILANLKKIMVTSNNVVLNISIDHALATAATNQGTAPTPANLSATPTATGRSTDLDGYATEGY